jgi:hypothetical protein
MRKLLIHIVSDANYIMKIVFFFMSILSFVILIVACNPEKEFELPYLEKQIVVDGWIELNNVPMVLLTYNTPYFSNLDSASLRQLVASRAKVTVSDGNVSEILTLYKDTNYFPPYIYKGSGKIFGRVNKTYHLLVEDEIDTVTAITTIPTAVSLDSVWFRLNSENDTLGQIIGAFNDNINEKNYYRTLVKESKTKKYIPTMISVFDDIYFNGQSFSFSLRRGFESNLKPLENIYFEKGKEYWLKVETLNKESYDFWSSVQSSFYASGNPFVGEHETIISNINGGLGVWAGYGISVYKIVAK